MKTKEQFREELLAVMATTSLYAIPGLIYGPPLPREMLELKPGPRGRMPGEYRSPEQAMWLTRREIR